MYVFLGAIIFLATTVLYSWPFLSLPMFFAMNLARPYFIPNVQVRVTSAIQLGFILLCIIVTTISYRKKGTYQPLPQMRNAPLIIGITCFIGTIVGFIKGNSFFNILADNYAYFEILLYYFFIVYTIRSTSELRTVFKILIPEMICFGIFEMFTKERGGTGLNICMSFLYIFICCGFYKKIKYYWIVIIISILMIFMSKTRTYMLAALSGMTLVFFMAQGYRKQLIRLQYIGLGIVFIILCVILFYNGNTAIQTIIDRILEVKSLGYEAGGYRIYEMNYALQKFQENPIFGTGLGFRQIITLPLMGRYEFGGLIHISYAGVLMKLGIFGSAILLYGLFQYLHNQHRQIKENEYSGNEEVAYVLIGGYIGTISWIIIYLAAPLSSYGSIFIPGVFSILYSELYYKETENNDVPESII